MPKACRYMQYRVDPDRLPAGVRIFGEGYVGGKAVGLIFVQSAVQFERRRLSVRPDLVRFPESTIVATDYFDEFMEANGLQQAVQDKCDGRLPKQDMATLFLSGELPRKLVGQLARMLRKEKRPLAVRSSSFLEDNLKHSFAGIYSSYFIPNRGTDAARLQQLEMAVKLVYLSTFGDNAREYRLKHQIAWRTEKMGVLIQNLIGREHPDRLFYPLLAGVGFSKNFYPWTEQIPVDGGVVRLVMGLGTRAVGRYYARVLSPAAPLLRPEGGAVSEILRYSQTEIDALDLETGSPVSPSLEDIKLHEDQIGRVTSELKEGTYFMDPPYRVDRETVLVLTFDPLLRPGSRFPFVPIMDSLLRDLQRLMGTPVDMEFAANMGAEEALYIVQVRPLGGRAEHRAVKLPRRFDPSRLVLSSHNVLGNGTKKGLCHIVYVPLEKYGFERGFEAARKVGELNAALAQDGYILIGPGRWATSHPELGVPVTYAEISNAQVIVECSYRDFTPELSYGTHIFGDMVVSNTLYIPVFLEKGDFLNRSFLNKHPSGQDHGVVRVVEVEEGFDVYADGRSRTGLIVRREKN